MSIYDEHFESMFQGKSSREAKRWFVAEAYEMDSGVETYQNAFGVTLEDMKGKKILDIGGRVSGKFTSETKEAGIDLVTFNPNIYSLRKQPEENVVEGIAQELPFKENTFDYVLSYATVPAYLPPVSDDYKTTFEGMYRISKEKGGQVILFPVYSQILESDVYKEIKREIESKAGKVEEIFWGIGKVGGHEVQAYRVIITKG